MTIHPSSLPKRDSRAPSFPVPLRASPFKFPPLNYHRAAETLPSNGMKKFVKSFQKMLANTGGGEDLKNLDMKKSSSFLTGFLAMLVAVGLLSSAGTARAALITIDIGSSGFNIGGINAGIPDYDYRLIANFPISGLNLTIYNDFSGFSGLLGSFDNLFAAGASPATPVKFALNDSIGSGSNYTWDAEGLFKFGSVSSPDFGAGSYMGFRTSQGNYGWLEVTWTAASSQFQILSGAYEDQVGVAILAGDTGTAAVPEPGQVAASLLLLVGIGGYVFIKRRKTAKPAVAPIAA